MADYSTLWDQKVCLTLTSVWKFKNNNKQNELVIRTVLEWLNLREICQIYGTIYVTWLITKLVGSCRCHVTCDIVYEICSSSASAWIYEFPVYERRNCGVAGAHWQRNRYIYDHPRGKCVVSLHVHSCLNRTVPQCRMCFQVTYSRRNAVLRSFMLGSRKQLMTAYKCVKFRLEIPSQSWENYKKL